MILKKNPFIYLFILLFLVTNDLSGQITVEITMPELGDGMAQIETLLLSNIGTAVSGIETMINSTLDKPEITRSFSNAAGLSGTMPLLGTMPLSSKLSFSTGVYAAVCLDSFDIEILTERFEALQPEDDFEFGVGIQGINMNLTIPFSFILPRLSLFLSMGYSDLSNGEFFIRNLSGHLSVGYHVFNRINPVEFFSWKPLFVQGGFSIGVNEIGTTIETGVISESFAMDPDGGGPLLSQSIVIEIDPVIDIGLESQFKTAAFSAASGITLLDSFHFFIGAGIGFMFGNTGISVRSEDDIEIAGYLSNLIEEPGSIAIRGTAEGGIPDLLQFYLYSGLQIDISNAFIGVSFLFHPVSGISAGFSIGTAL